MNSVVLSGFLTKEPELRKTGSNISTCSFSIGVTRDYKDANGNYQSDFPNCVAWRQGAEYLCKYGHKGDKVEIQGQLQTRSYDDNTGRRVYVTEVVADKVKIDSRRDEKQEQRYESQQNDSVSSESVYGNDALPFY